jgi:hypothetical protein
MLGPCQEQVVYHVVAGGARNHRIKFWLVPAPSKGETPEPRWIPHHEPLLAGATL